MCEDYSMPTELFTIGYEQRTQDELIRELRTAGVRRLVDVRELPLSRKRGFSKSALGEALAEAQIEYQHVRALGNPKPIRELYWDGKVELGAARYREHLSNGSRSAVIDLAEALDSIQTCLMCVERDNAVCHRAVLVAELELVLDRLHVTNL